MASNINFSYSYQLQVRDLSGAINMAILAAPTLLSLIGISDRPAKNHKFEWLEDQLTPKQDTTAGTATNSATTVDVTTPAVFRIGDMWLNARTEERILVTGIASATLTIVRGLGGTGVAMLSGDTLKLISRAQDEGTDPGEDTGHEAVTVYNYTQILDRTAKVTATALATSMYGMDDLMNREVMLQMDDIVRELNMSAIWGTKNQRTGKTATTRGRMDGLIAFLAQSGALKVDAAGAGLTKAMMNDSLEKAFINGAGRLAAICNTKQARAITALDANYQIVREDRTSGKQILAYQGDIAGNNVTPAAIVVEPNYSPSRVDFVDLERVKLVPMEGRAMHDMDATPPGADYAARRVLGEYTLQVRNAKQAHASVYNLA